MTLALLTVLLAASGVRADGLPPPILSARLYSIAGGWGKDSRYPSSPVPAADGDSAAKLEDSFSGQWKRRGPDVWLTITRKNGAFCGMIGVAFALSPTAESLTYSMMELPVTEPLRGLAPGRLAASWNLNTPWWLLVRAGEQSAGVLFDTTDGHGFDSWLGSDGAQFVFRFYLPQPGQTKRVHFRFVPAATAPGLKAAAREMRQIPPDSPVNPAAAERLRRQGFVRVDRSGTGFVTADGTPFHPVGLNSYGTALPHLPAAEQERRLQQMAAAGMTATRIIITDWSFRPLPHVVNEAGLARLGETVDRCAAHGLRVLICLELSGVAYQYHASLRLSPYWEDIFRLPEVLDWYRELVDHVVRPLRDDPAVMAWTVTNEPVFNLFPNPENAPLTEAFRAWLKAQYGSDDGLARAWGEAVPGGLAQVPQPTKDAFEAQNTPAARDFLRWQMGVTGQAMVARARLIKAADPNHLVAISDCLGRGLRGVPGAEILDFWAPHTYELWLNGPPIERHAAFLARYYRDALPDRPRPVMIEEFGITPSPKFPAPMRAEHAREFLAAAQRFGLAGLLHWDFEEETAPELLVAFKGGLPWRPIPGRPGSLVAAYLPPSQDFNIFVYSRYMTRRGWDANVACALAAGCEVRVVGSAREAAGARAVLVLADRLRPEEAREARQAGLPLYVLPGAKEAAQALPEATVLPGEEAAQRAVWDKLK